MLRRLGLGFRPVLLESPAFHSESYCNRPCQISAPNGVGSGFVEFGDPVAIPGVLRPLRGRPATRNADPGVFHCAATPGYFLASLRLAPDPGVTPSRPQPVEPFEKLRSLWIHGIVSTTRNLALPLIMRS